MSDNISEGTQRRLANLKPFRPGQSGNPAGRPPGIPDLSTRVRRLLEGDDTLPEAIVDTIRKAVGADRKALDAILIAGMLQALQGDERWGKLLLERGYGKVPDALDLTTKGKELKQTAQVDAATLAEAMRRFEESL